MKFLVARGVDISSGEESACFFVLPMNASVLERWYSLEEACLYQVNHMAVKSEALAVRFDDDLWLEPSLGEDGWALLPLADVMGHSCTTLACNGVELWVYPRGDEGEPAGVKFFIRLPDDGINGREVYWTCLVDFAGLDRLLTD